MSRVHWRTPLVASLGWCKMTDLERLLSLRKRRHEASVERVNSAKRRLKSSRKNLGTATQTLENFKDELAQLEKRLLSEILRKKIKASHIERIHQELKDAAKHAETLINNVTEAEASVDRAFEGLQDSKTESKIAEQKRSKIHSLRQDELKQKEVMATRAEEAEMDDVAEIIFAVRSRMS